MLQSTRRNIRVDWSIIVYNSYGKTVSVYFLLPYYSLHQNVYSNCRLFNTHNSESFTDDMFNNESTRNKLQTIGTTLLPIKFERTTEIVNKLR